MPTAKEEAIGLIQRMPEDCTLTDIVAELHFKRKVERGLKDVDEGPAHTRRSKGADEGMGTVRWSVTAKQDLQDIGDYIVQDSPFYAIDFVERILDYVGELADVPMLGRVVPEFGRSDVRERIFHNYRVVYKQDSGDVFVLSVCHGSMDLAAKATREGWGIG